MQFPTGEGPSDQNLIVIGIFAKVHLLDGKIVRKVPRSNSQEDIAPIQREATIYAVLGEHPRIVQCLSFGQTDYVDVKYYPNGDLESYLHENESTIEPSQKTKWFEQIIQGVSFIHGRGVLHSDLTLRQHFVDDDLNVRLADFNASQYLDQIALGYEKATHCLPRDYEEPNTVRSDLFALGSTLHELSAGKSPYSEIYPIEADAITRSNDHAVIMARIQRKQQADSKVEALYTQQIFPNVSDLFGGDIILGCWRGDFSTAEEVLLRFQALKNVI